MFEKWQDKLTDFEEWLQDVFFLLNEPKWGYRSAFYIFFFACVWIAFGLAILTLSSVFPDYDFLYGINPDNARYMLSALIQSLAAVVAIVVTLSLIAIQLSAQSYSSRVIDVYKKTPDIWILILIYTTNIFFGLATIKIIGTSDLPTNGLFSLEFFIFTAYFMGFFAFICLIPYTWNTLALLNPSKIMQLLAEDITEQKLLDTSKNSDFSDPLAPILDIIRGSLMKDDQETQKIGFRAILDHINPMMNENNQETISLHVFYQIIMVGKLAIDRNDEPSTIVAIGSLKTGGLNAADRELNVATNTASYALVRIAEKALEKEMEEAIQIAITALRKIGEKAAEKGMDDNSKVAIRLLEEIGKKTAAEKMAWPTLSSIYALKSIGEKAIEKNEKFVTRTISIAIIALKEVGEKIPENDTRISCDDTVNAISDIGKKAAEKMMEREVQIVLKVLKDMKEEAKGSPNESIIYNEYHDLKKLLYEIQQKKNTFDVD